MYICFTFLVHTLEAGYKKSGHKNNNLPIRWILQQQNHANCLVQGDNSGQRLHFVDFIFKITEYCPTALQMSAQFQLPQQNQADSGTTKW